MPDLWLSIALAYMCLCCLLSVLCVLCVYLVDTKTQQSQHNINKQNATKCGYQRDLMQQRDTVGERERASGSE